MTNELHVRLLDLADPKPDPISSTSTFRKLLAEPTVWVTLLTVLGGNLLGYVVTRAQKQRDLATEQLKEDQKSREAIILTATEATSQVITAANALMDTFEPLMNQKLLQQQKTELAQYEELAKAYNQAEISWRNKSFLVFSRVHLLSQPDLRTAEKRWLAYTQAMEACITAFNEEQARSEVQRAQGPKPDRARLAKLRAEVETRFVEFIEALNRAA